MAEVTRKNGSGNDGMGAVVERNIAALLARRQVEEENKSRQERLADNITRFTGSMTFVYLHLMIFGLWIFVNLGWIPVVPRFDPSFVVLAMVASVEAIFLSTFVLISQNRMQAVSDRRADLDLHVSLLAEHEVTRLITLVAAIAARMGIEEAHNPELQELSKDVAPEQVLDKMTEAEQDLEQQVGEEEPVERGGVAGQEVVGDATGSARSVAGSRD